MSANLANIRVNVRCLQVSVQDRKMDAAFLARLASFNGRLFATGLAPQEAEREEAR